VGALGTTPHAGNGGFSLRKRAAMINVTRRWVPRPPPAMPEDVEDIYFQMYGAQLGLRFAPHDVARRFASENIYTPRSLANHQGHMKYTGAQLAELYQFCPAARSLPASKRRKR